MFEEDWLEEKIFGFNTCSDMFLNKGEWHENNSNG